MTRNDVLTDFNVNYTRKMTFLKCLCLGLILALTTNNLSQPGAADLPEEIRIPALAAQKVSSDGIFFPGEWEAAKKFLLKDGYSLLIMADQDYLYTALKFPEPMGECVMELRITPDSKKVYVLHVSGDLGEGVSDFPTNTGFTVGTHNDWESNPTKIDSAGRQAWIEAGQPLDRYDEIYKPREGIEFIINRDKLAGNATGIQVSWIRVEVNEGEIVKNTYNYPLKAGLKSADFWSRLTFAD